MHKMCCLKKANQLKTKKKIKKNRASQPASQPPEGGGETAQWFVWARFARKIVI